MAFSQYALCKDCRHGFTRHNGRQDRCGVCQAESERLKAREYKARHRLKRGNVKRAATNPDEYLYTIVKDPLQPEWHGKITNQSVTEGLRQATFSEGTILRCGRGKFKVVGATAPYPFMRAAEAQRLEEL